MQYSKTMLALLALMACLLVQQRVWAQSQFKVPVQVAGNGGTASASGSNRLTGTLGQVTIGTSQNATQRIGAGFWHLPDHVRFTRPPDTWNFVSNTGGNATIAVPAAINPAIGPEPLQTSHRRHDSFQAATSERRFPALFCWRDRQCTGCDP